VVIGDNRLGLENLAPDAGNACLQAIAGRGGLGLLGFKK